jgi:thioredoxin-like negative regulator of GroEL
MSIFKNIALLCIVAILSMGGFTVANANDDIRIVKINDSNFEKEILQSKKPVILEISSTSCPPCLIMIPTLISIAKNYSDIKVASVGIDEPNLDKVKATLPVQAFPTFCLIKDG